LLIENVSESIFLSKICFFIDKCILLLIFHQFTSVITVCDSQGCGMWVIDNEDIHLHHIDGNHNNRKPNNLMAVHQSCHQYIHTSKREA
ncbi:MAG: HNH endonuclease signature motif containing protein, partial [Nostocales cyanobacterium LacPavin_0920_SED1_MAG_38_18]|nr:HNH endonuclease signature motif containing protein [Nostocales cyanobacterium LacPavin_0920_SED1_MAG_38_18]